jgi:multisubunit Na+/H+ antiporter MnhF subunit
MENRELNRLAVRATLHCLSGCAVGEVLGSTIGSGLNWSNMATESLTIPLAFTFGYAFTMRPLLRHGLGPRRATRLALASDTLSITTMEIIDTLIILSIPGALAAGPSTGLFWGSLALALLGAFICAVPVNRYLISRGKGHAVLHDHH